MKRKVRLGRRKSMWRMIMKYESGRGRGVRKRRDIMKWLGERRRWVGWELGKGGVGGNGESEG